MANSWLYVNGVHTRSGYARSDVNEALVTDRNVSALM